MDRVDLAAIDDCVKRSLALLERTYRSGPEGVGGWYHQMESALPGPSATAVGMTSFLMLGQPFEHLHECVGFLRERQVSSSDPARDGGWAVNTSLGQPVTESTGLVARALGVGRLMLVSGAPAVDRALSWLDANQNRDGGWGSLYGQESRVWLTAMAVRALVALNPHGEPLRRGVDWLVKHRDPNTRAWGERPASSPTVTHTSYVLTALVESRPTCAIAGLDDAVAAGYAWLVAHVDPTAVHDEAARVESYNVATTGDRGQPLVWHSTVWHPGLPYAVHALTLQPGGPPMDLLAGAVQTILATQLDDGRWPVGDSAAALSVWAVWPFLEALAAVMSHGGFARGDVVNVLSPGAFVVQRGRERGSPLNRVLWRSYGRGIRPVLRRQWSVAVLVLFTGGGLLAVFVAGLGWREFGFGLLVPVVLVVIQSAMMSRAGR